MDATKRKPKMPRLPRMTFEEGPCNRLELEEGGSQPSNGVSKAAGGQAARTSQARSYPGSGHISTELQPVGFFWRTGLTPGQVL